MNQALYTGRRLRRHAIQCEVMAYRSDPKMEELGIDVEDEEEWVPGMIRLDSVVVAIEETPESTKVWMNEDNPIIIRMSFAEFWEIYANSQAP